MRINQYYALKSIDDIIQFGGVRLQKLASCRYIEEEILNQEITSYRARTRFLIRKTTTRDRQMSTEIITRHACLRFYLRHRCNRCKCFSTKAHGMK